MKKSLIDVIKKIHALEPLTSDEKKEYVNYSLCVNHGGKMEGINSCSTSCLCNKYCEARRHNDKLICKSCYAAAQLEYQSSTRKKLETNFIFYNNYELHPEDMPPINDDIFRLEAFGDVASVTAVKNQYTLARASKNCLFVAWSKNPVLYSLAGSKPRNFILIYSEPEINKEYSRAEFDLLKKEYPFVNKVFCVFTKEYAAAHAVNVNCGGKHCRQCMTCYSRNKEWYVKELLK